MSTPLTYPAGDDTRHGLNGHHSNNGHATIVRPSPPGDLRTMAMLAEALDDLAVNLAELQGTIDDALARLDDASQFLDYKVGIARMRERRRVRRGARKAAR